MTFFVQGLNNHELMPLDMIFKPDGVAKSEATAAMAPVDEHGRHGSNEHKRCQSGAERNYRDIDTLSQAYTALHAERIMTSPVFTLSAGMTIGQALDLFKERRFRHLPVLASEGILAGMVSDRDVLVYVAGFSDDGGKGAARALNVPVDQLMRTSVLTASRDTDVRHIARLFVERRIGALPIMQGPAVMGMITRSDILRSVMSNFTLELWA